MSQRTKTKADPATGETQGKAGNMILFDLRQLTRFRDEGPSVQILSDSGVARVVLFAFKAGQSLKEHRTSSPILVQALRGRVTFSANGTQARLQAGTILQLEANVPHSVLAQTDAVVLVTMTPSPTYHSLEREVFQGITPLVTRTTEAGTQQ
jgi:quercetin dioxygenase-like cupin family protein